jgi:hypothetical protein
MREIRTYGLTRGCWPVRPARRAGVYSTTLHNSLRNPQVITFEDIVLFDQVRYATGW